MAMYCYCCGNQPCDQSSSASAPRTFWGWKMEWRKRTKSRFPKLGYIWYMVVWTLTMIETEFKKKED